MKRAQIFSFLVAVSVFFTLFAWQPVPVSAATSGVQFDPGGSIAASINLATNQADPVNTSVRLINVVLGLLSLIAVVLVIYAGFTWMLSAGNSEKIGKARGLLINAAIGLLIIMAAYGISKYVFTKLNEAAGGSNVQIQHQQRNV